MRSHSQIPGVRTSAYLCGEGVGGTILPTEGHGQNKQKNAHFLAVHISTAASSAVHTQAMVDAAFTMAQFNQNASFCGQLHFVQTETSLF